MIFKLNSRKNTSGIFFKVSLLTSLCIPAFNIELNILIKQSHLCDYSPANHLHSKMYSFCLWCMLKLHLNYICILLTFRALLILNGISILQKENLAILIFYIPLIVDKRECGNVPNLTNINKVGLL